MTPRPDRFPSPNRSIGLSFGPRVVPTRRAPGFALVEALAIFFILALVVAVLLPMGHRSRRQAGLGHSIANLRQYAAGTSSYAADNADRFWTFSWRGRQAPPEPTDPDLVAWAQGGDDLAAASAQAIHILRRRTGRTDLFPISNWIPHVLYSHLVLANYLEAELPLRFAVSPGDANRLCWSANPLNPGACAVPPPDPTSAAGKRWPYSSSYELGVAFMSPDVGATITGAGSHNTYSITGGAVLGGRRISEVAIPSAKAMVWESADRFQSTRASYWMMPEARTPNLFVDGHVEVRAAASMNLGFNPAAPDSAGATSVNYQPLAWEPSIQPGQSATVIARQRFTRQGLLGRDLGGPEITTR